MRSARKAEQRVLHVGQTEVPVSTFSFPHFMHLLVDA